MSEGCVQGTRTRPISTAIACSLNAIAIQLDQGIWVQVLWFPDLAPGIHYQALCWAWPSYFWSQSVDRLWKRACVKSQHVSQSGQVASRMWRVLYMELMETQDIENVERVESSCALASLLPMKPQFGDCIWQNMSWPYILGWEVVLFIFWLVMTM